MAYNIEHCRSCINKGFNPNLGLTCNLTNEKPNYDGICNDYVFNENYKPPVRSKIDNAYFKSVPKVIGWVRFANYIIDLFIFYLIAVFLTILAINSGKDDFFYEPILPRIFGIVMYLIYYSLLEGITKGRSIGKFITGTVAVDVEGNRIDGGLAIKRSLCRIIPFEPFSFLGPSSSGWHDKINDTCVIRMRDLKERKKSFNQDNNLLDSDL